MLAKTPDRPSFSTEVVARPRLSISRNGWVFAFVAVVVLTGCATTSSRPTVVIAAGEPAPGDAAFARQMAFRLTDSRVPQGGTFHRAVEEQTGPNPHRAR